MCVGSETGAPDVEVKMSILDIVLVLSDSNHHEMSDLNMMDNDLNFNGDDLIDTNFEDF